MDLFQTIGKELNNSCSADTAGSWNLDIINTDKCTRTAARRKAKELFRAFGEATKSEISREFIERARLHLTLLHTYNNVILLRKNRYPRTKWMFYMLCRYVVLEFEGLGSDPDPNSCDVDYLVLVLESILYNYFDYDSEIRSKMLIVHIVVTVYQNSQIPKWYMEKLTRLVLKGTIIQEQLDDVCSSDDDLLYVGNIWSNDHLKYFMESDDFATDDEDSDTDQEEMHGKKERFTSLEILDSEEEEEEDDEDVLLISYEKNNSDHDITKHFNDISKIQNGLSKEDGGRNNNNNVDGVYKSIEANSLNLSIIPPPIITIDDDDDDDEIVKSRKDNGKSKKMKFDNSDEKIQKPIYIDDDEEDFFVTSYNSTINTVGNKSIIENKQSILLLTINNDIDKTTELPQAILKNQTNSDINDFTKKEDNLKFLKGLEPKQSKHLLEIDVESEGILQIDSLENNEYILEAPEEFATENTSISDESMLISTKSVLQVEEIFLKNKSDTNEFNINNTDINKQGNSTRKSSNEMEAIENLPIEKDETIKITNTNEANAIIEEISENSKQSIKNILTVKTSPLDEKHLLDGKQHFNILELQHTNLIEPIDSGITSTKSNIESVVENSLKVLSEEVSNDHIKNKEIPEKDSSLINVVKPEMETTNDEKNHKNHSSSTYILDESKNSSLDQNQSLTSKEASIIEEPGNTLTSKKLAGKSAIHKATLEISEDPLIKTQIYTCSQDYIREDLSTNNNQILNSKELSCNKLSDQLIVQDVKTQNFQQTENLVCQSQDKFSESSKSCADTEKCQELDKYKILRVSQAENSQLDKIQEANQTQETMKFQKTENVLDQLSKHEANKNQEDKNLEDPINKEQTDSLIFGVSNFSHKTDAVKSNKLEVIHNDELGLMSKVDNPKLNETKQNLVLSKTTTINDKELPLLNESSPNQHAECVGLNDAQLICNQSETVNMNDTCADKEVKDINTHVEDLKNNKQSSTEIITQEFKDEKTQHKLTEHELKTENKNLQLDEKFTPKRDIQADLLQANCDGFEKPADEEVEDKDANEIFQDVKEKVQKEKNRQNNDESCTNSSDINYDLKKSEEFINSEILKSIKLSIKESILVNRTVTNNISNLANASSSGKEITKITNGDNHVKYESVDLVVKNNLESRLKDFQKGTNTETQEKSSQKDREAEESTNKETNTLPYDICTIANESLSPLHKTDQEIAQNSMCDDSSSLLVEADTVANDAVKISEQNTAEFVYHRDKTQEISSSEKVIIEDKAITIVESDKGAVTDTSSISEEKVEEVNSSLPLLIGSRQLSSHKKTNWDLLQSNMQVLSDVAEKQLNRECQSPVKFGSKKLKESRFKEESELKTIIIEKSCTLIEKHVESDLVESNVLIENFGKENAEIGCLKTKNETNILEVQLSKELEKKFTSQVNNDNINLITKNLKTLNSNEDSSDSFEGRLVIPDEPTQIDCSTIPSKTSEIIKEKVIPTKMMCDMEIQPEPVPSLAEAVNQLSVCQDVSSLVDANKKSTNYDIDYILGHAKPKDVHNEDGKNERGNILHCSSTVIMKPDVDSLPYSVNNLLKLNKSHRKSKIIHSNVQISECKSLKIETDINNKNKSITIKSSKMVLNKTKTEECEQKENLSSSPVTPKKLSKVTILENVVIAPKRINFTENENTTIEPNIEITTDYSLTEQDGIMVANNNDKKTDIILNTSSKCELHMDAIILGSKTFEPDNNGETDLTKCKYKIEQTQTGTNSSVNDDPISNSSEVLVSEEKTVSENTLNFSLEPCSLSKTNKEMCENPLIDEKNSHNIIDCGDITSCNNDKIIESNRSSKVEPKEISENNNLFKETYSIMSSSDTIEGTYECKNVDNNAKTNKQRKIIECRDNTILKGKKNKTDIDNQKYVTAKYNSDTVDISDNKVGTARNQSISMILPEVEMGSTLYSSDFEFQNECNISLVTIDSEVNETKIKDQSRMIENESPNHSEFIQTQTTDLITDQISCKSLSRSDEKPYEKNKSSTTFSNSKDRDQRKTSDSYLENSITCYNSIESSKIVNKEQFKAVEDKNKCGENNFKEEKSQSKDLIINTSVHDKEDVKVNDEQSKEEEQIKEEENNSKEETCTKLEIIPLEVGKQNADKKEGESNLHFQNEQQDKGYLKTEEKSLKRKRDEDDTNLHVKCSTAIQEEVSSKISKHVIMNKSVVINKPNDADDHKNIIENDTEKTFEKKHYNIVNVEENFCNKITEQENQSTSSQVVQTTNLEQNNSQENIAINEAVKNESRRTSINVETVDLPADISVEETIINDKPSLLSDILLNKSYFNIKDGTIQSKSMGKENVEENQKIHTPKKQIIESNKYQLEEENEVNKIDNIREHSKSTDGKIPLLHYKIYDFSKYQHENRKHDNIKNSMKHNIEKISVNESKIEMITEEHKEKPEELEESNSQLDFCNVPPITTVSESINPTTSKIDPFSHPNDVFTSNFTVLDETNNAVETQVAPSSVDLFSGGDVSNVCGTNSSLPTLEFHETLLNQKNSDRSPLALSETQSSEASQQLSEKTYLASDDVFVPIVNKKEITNEEEVVDYFSVAENLQDEEELSLVSQNISEISTQLSIQENTFPLANLGFADMETIIYDEVITQVTSSPENILKEKELFNSDTIKEIFLHKSGFKNIERQHTFEDHVLQTPKIISAALENSDAPELDQTKTTLDDLVKKELKLTKRNEQSKSPVLKAELVGNDNFKKENKDAHKCVEIKLLNKIQKLDIAHTHKMLDKMPNLKPKKKSEMDINGSMQNQKKRPLLHEGTEVQKNENVKKFKNDGGDNDLFDTVKKSDPKTLPLPSTSILGNNHDKSVKNLGNVKMPHEVVKEVVHKKYKPNISQENVDEKEIYKKHTDRRHSISSDQGLRHHRSSQSRRHTPDTSRNCKSVPYPTNSDKYKYHSEVATNRGHASSSMNPRRIPHAEGRFRRYEPDHITNSRSHAEQSAQIDSRYKHRHYSDADNNRVHTSGYYSSTHSRPIYTGLSVVGPHDKNWRDSYLDAHHYNWKQVTFPLSNVHKSSTPRQPQKSETSKEWYENFDLLSRPKNLFFPIKKTDDGHNL